MASKVPKFGEWEGGENYTVYFDTARKNKTNGPMINPNDPQENPSMFSQNGGSKAQPPRAADPKGQKSQAPQFGAWDNGENVGYTAYFENKRKAKNGQPTVPANEPQMNRDMHPSAQPQARPQPAKVEPQQAPKQEARSKVPKFGAWQQDEGETAYTQYFENVRKNIRNGRTVTPEPSEPAPAKEGRSKVPQFGAWEGGEGGAYTAYFENARKPKIAGPVLDNFEPFNMGRFPLVNFDLMSERSPRPARPDEELAYGGGGRLDFKNRDRKIDGELKNAALTTGFSASLAHPESVQKEPKLFQDPRMTLNNDLECEGRRQLPPEDSQLLPETTGHSNNKNDGHSKIAPRGFQASAVGSKAPVRKETKILKSTSNDNPASDHLSYRESNHKEKKMGSCLPWLRRGMKHRLLKQ